MNTKPTIAKVGRPTKFTSGRMSRVTITLPDSYIRYLKHIGEGNLSMAVRTLTSDSIKRSVKE